VGELPCLVIVRCVEVSRQPHAAMGWKPDYHPGHVIEDKGTNDLSRPTSM
jgi:hypothetical protein